MWDFALSVLVYLLWIFLLSKDEGFINATLVFVWSIILICENGWDFSQYYSAMIANKTYINHPSALMACQSEQKISAILIVPVLLRYLKRTRARIPTGSNAND